MTVVQDAFLVFKQLSVLTHSHISFVVYFPGFNHEKFNAISVYFLNVFGSTVYFLTISRLLLYYMFTLPCSECCLVCTCYFHWCGQRVTSCCCVVASVQMEAMMGPSKKQLAILSAVLQLSAQTTSERMVQALKSKLIKKSRDTLGAPKGKRVSTLRTLI